MLPVSPPARQDPKSESSGAELSDSSGSAEAGRMVAPIPPVTRARETSSSINLPTRVEVNLCSWSGGPIDAGHPILPTTRAIRTAASTTATRLRRTAPRCSQGTRGSRT